MSTIVTRAGKGSPLTNTEVDSNFTNLNADKVESITSADGSVVVSTSGTTRDLSVGIANSTATLISQVRNQTGATLTKGTVVYISGASGNKALISKALATSDATSAQTYGVVQADIPTNQNGYVVIIGAVSGLNTSAYPDGTQLYLSPTTAGTFTDTKPYAPQHLVYVGVVTYSHATQGTIQIKIQNGYEMDELHNVSAQSPTNGQTLVYNTTTSLWEKNTVSLTAGVNGILPVANGGTGQTTLQNAMDALAGAVTSGSYLRGNGTDVVMSAIQAADVPTLNQNTTGTAANVTGTVAIANGGTGSTTATAALTALGAYPALNPSGYTSNTGTVTGVTGTAPVVSSGGTAPAISMAAASAGVNGYMTGAYATKLDGIATGATANTGTVTSVSGTGTVSGLTLSGTVTGAGSLTLGGAIGTLNQNTTGTAGGLTGTPNITVGTITAGDITTYRSGAPTTGYIYWGNTGTKYMGFDGANIVASVSPSFSITGSSASCTGNAATASAVAFSGITSKPTTLSGYGITNADVSGGNLGGSFNFNTNANLASGTYGFDTGALNGPASVVYSQFLQIKERPDTSAQIVVDYQTGYMYTRGIYLTAPTYSAWQTQLSSGNYNSYAPTLTGTGASGTWGINVTGTSGSISGFNNPTTAASANTIVYRDGSGHITGVYGFFQYLNMSHGASGATTDTVFYSSGDDYIRKNNATGFRASLNVPTRTGGDASGTWNIKSRSLNAVRTSNTDFNSLSTAQDTFTAGTNYIPSGGAYNQPDTGDHHYLSWGSIDGSAWAAQLDIDFYTDRVWFRRQYSTTWQAWRQLIHDGNYTSYAMPSGSSATNSVDVRAPLFYDYNNTGYYVDPNGTSNVNQFQSDRTYGFADIRSPIFYDYNNTTYYIDGNNISSLFGLAIRGDQNSTSTSNQLFLWDGGGTTTSAIGFKANGGQFANPTGNGDGYNTYLTMDTDGRGWVFRRGTGGSDFTAAVTSGWILNNGLWQANASMRAPIFYDSNDTGYYVNPNGTSQFNTVNANATCNFTATACMYAYGMGNTASASGTGINVYSNNGSGAIMAFHRGGYYAIQFGLDSDNVIRFGGWSAAANRLQMDMSGNLTMAGNVTAYSDERLKKDWALLPDNFIESLAQLKSGTYTRIDSEERQAGISAQGLQKFLPEVVQTDASDTLSVNYGSAAMVSAVELAKEVVDLRARVAQLESLISKLIGD